MPGTALLIPFVLPRRLKEEVKMNFEQTLKMYAQMTNEAIERYLPSTDCLQKSVCEAMAYSIRAGGKRIRPVLVLAFNKACGGESENVLPLACAIEMVHTYSLIHDDLPCMDNDDLRRGKPSCHVKFGYSTAMLAGDALLSLAFETALCNNDKRRIKPENLIAAAGELAKASGATGMVGGQVIDLLCEGKKSGLETVMEMDRKKTGAMIEAAAKIGCIAAGVGEDKIRAAKEYAQRIGLAFQIEDDVLDYTSTDETLGKPVGSDCENKKSTYVTLLGLEESRQYARKLTEEAKEWLSVFGDGGEFLFRLADYLAERDR